MRKRSSGIGSAPQESIIPILPAIVAGMLNFVAAILFTIHVRPDLSQSQQSILVLFGIAGCTYIGLYYWLYTTSANKSIYTWINSIVAGVALGFLLRYIPQEIIHLVHSLLLITALASAVISERAPSYLFIVIVAILNGVLHSNSGQHIIAWGVHGMFLVATVILVETIQQVKSLSKRQIKRLETVNEISKQIVSTLDTRQLISLLNTALQNALDADTYYIGTKEGDDLQMQLFYDDGEYFNDILYKMEGSLSEWVINNQRPLFLPDLRKPLNIEGINVVTVGKPKTSLSWMGVPMTGTHVKGIIAVASYHPNAFNRSDFELLINTAQRAALALDNTYHHALVGQEARLDSLTRVLNHGFFINNLREQADECLTNQTSLSLIMLDIDHFKQYNDSFGHPAGDEILVNLCEIIRTHIKQKDAVGRWGGEEFAISLPNTNIEQAMLVAKRIRQTLAEFKLAKNKTFPIPTVSMGIAVFPEETDDINKLIDLADRRLYVAKERGRDQIESLLTV